MFAISKHVCVSKMDRFDPKVSENFIAVSVVIFAS